MNKRILVWLIVLLPLLMGGSCEKRMFEFIGNSNLDKTFTIDNTGSFLESRIVTDNDIRSFLDDLPKDAKVTDVKISAMSVRLEPKEGNEVKTLSLSGTITDTESSQDIFIGADYPVPLVGVDIAFVGINNLIANGVAKLKRKLQKKIMQNEFGNFELVLEGIPSIGGERLLLDIKVRIKIQIEYQQCIEVWDFLEGGEECTIETQI